MTTTTAAPATRPPALTLDERLALASLAMDDRLATAALAVDVNTAHIPVDPLPQITIPLPPAAAPTPYRTPLAALLHRARVRIETDGWARGACRDEDGRRCAIGAIRAEADSPGQADDASALLLDIVRRGFGGDTVPSWNDAQTSPRPVLLALSRAADHAHNHNL
ncbi:hypothetical protein [Streptomyces sp. SCL15-4]|uniref:DUF6197 family protein n=1 Tax=Streptomyces sp. SCL15-4 TaxID=2967221 RepID=UPI0029670B28|nr:hypothetical protein [Streptomyces sp. SCL15-4]